MRPRLAVRLSSLVAAAGLVALTAALGSAAAIAEPASNATTAPTSTPTLGGWTVSADANGLDITADNATGLAGVHPLDEVDLPEAESSFSTGPVGSGLAAVLWPGAAGGNLGSLSTELPIPAALQALIANGNDPVKASAQYPAGPTVSTYPSSGDIGPVVMRATSEPGGTTADAALTAENFGSLLSIEAADSTSSAVATTSASAQATSYVSGISILGGLITIGAVTSTADASSNGDNAKGSTVTHVGQVDVLGTPTSIGTDGLVLPSLGGILDPVVAALKPLLQQTISALGLTITSLPSSETTTGPLESVTSGGLRMSVSVPPTVSSLLEQVGGLLEPYFPSEASALFIVPGLFQGLTVTVTIGRSIASAGAETDESLGLGGTPPTSVTSPLASSNLPQGTIPALPPSGSTSAAPASLSSPTSSSTSSPARSSTGPPTAAVTTPISLTTAVGATAVALAVLAILAAGFGMSLFARKSVPTDEGPSCPLREEGP